MTDDYPYPSVQEKYRIGKAVIMVSTSPDGSTPADRFTSPTDEKLLAYVAQNRRGALTIYRKDGSLLSHTQGKLNQLITQMDTAWRGRLLQKKEHDRQKTALKRKAKGLPEPLVFDA